MFLDQHPSDRTEDDLVRVDRELQLRKALDHVHNLRSKVADALSDALHSELAKAVPEELKGLVDGCSGFKDITRLFATFPKDAAVRERLDQAAERFCAAHNMAFGFWGQSSELDKLSDNRNHVLPYKVADSAAALSSDGVDEVFPEFEPADAIIDALAKYAAMHGDRLDAEAEEEQQFALRAKEELKKLRVKSRQDKQ
ncbi:hypothetical protein PLESTB_000100600 [Pleodorina starrii]|uniref:Uncharacterized protein n=1 Tax=Pleodorina starrii TaxID=330485 RepID=A0A9W6EX95_9CHLO|nr:hypothetical protein PLESTM_000097100 [Pleodorina starrii]GLC48462.1 hypothetical protein PLESTB_000100600 [Pleodorina starrii]GLC71782.1 hypothetical protein PLESTF_001166400 [Pleodorina starrii]